MKRYYDYDTIVHYKVVGQLRNATIYVNNRRLKSIE